MREGGDLLKERKLNFGLGREGGGREFIEMKEAKFRT